MSTVQELLFIIIVPLVIALGLVNLFWYLLARVDARFVYKAKTASLVAVAFVFLRATDYFSLLIQRATAPKAGAAATQPAGPEAAKQEFLRTVEFFANNPAQYNAEMKTKLFEQFQGLFPKGPEDLKVYRQEVGNAFLCQLALNEDALNTAKQKKKVRSQPTEQCAKLPGTFFGRPQLIPAEIIANHDKMLDLIVKGDKAAPKEKDLQAVVEQQRQRVAVVQKIFE